MLDVFRTYREDRMRKFSSVTKTSNSHFDGIFSILTMQQVLCHLFTVSFGFQVNFQKFAL